VYFSVDFSELFSTGVVFIFLSFGKGTLAFYLYFPLKKILVANSNDGDSDRLILATAN
jgi:hypothetical protein